MSDLNLQARSCVHPTHGVQQVLIILSTAMTSEKNKALHTHVNGCHGYSSNPYTEATQAAEISYLLVVNLFGETRIYRS